MGPRGSGGARNLREIAQRMGSSWYSRLGLARSPRRRAVLVLCLFVVAVSLVSLIYESTLDASSAAAPPPYYRNHRQPSTLLNYARRHAQLLHSHGGVVIYEPPANMTSVASPLLGLVSSFFFALVTDRALVVDWPEAIRSPVAVDDPDNPFAWEWGEEERVQLSDLFERPGFSWDARNFRWMEEARSQAVDISVSDSFEPLFCSDLGEAYGDVKYLRFQTDKYFLPLLALNPHVRNILLNDLALRPASLFETLSNFLVRPVNVVLNRVLELQEQTEGKVVVGLHIASSEMALELETQHNFFRAAEAAAQIALRHFDESKTGIVVLAASDSPSTFAGGDSGFTSVGFTGQGVQRFRDELVMLWALGMSDQVFTTPTSAFSVVAHARTSLRPVLVLDATTTYQSLTSQPCLASLGLIEETTCFTNQPVVLQSMEWDVRTPC